MPDARVRRRWVGLEESRRNDPEAGRSAPRASRGYWICQIAGWGSFAIYVLASYLWVVGRACRLTDVASILFFNVVVCPLVTHGVRREIHERGWIDLPLRRLVPRLTLVVPVLAGLLTAMVDGYAFVLNRYRGLSGASLAGIFFGFCWAFAGWLLVYFIVHARRRHDALRLELAVTSRDAQLQSLRAQLNPHFLFNCLNSLRSLIVEDPARAASMVTGLAEILRYSLASDRKDAVRFAEELAVIDEYIALERIRFEERLRIERAVEPAALDARIPPMLVQTLVENAVKHGISELPRGGLVRIEARTSGDRLEIRIFNTGRLKPSTGAAGYGLRNAMDRLRLLYGDVASLTLRENEGTTVATLILPLEPPNERATR